MRWTWGGITLLLPYGGMEAWYTEVSRVRTDVPYIHDVSTDV
jgi:hypothetical protein